MKLKKIGKFLSAVLAIGFLIAVYTAFNPPTGVLVLEYHMVNDQEDDVCAVTTADFKQQLDYLAYIDLYHERIRMFHVKDAEFRPTGRQGVYSGYAPWKERAGRFRSLGDGQIDFKAIFSKFAQYGYRGWAVLEWECALKDPVDGAREGATFIRDHIIQVTGKNFDDFVATGVDAAANRRLLGLDR